MENFSKRIFQGKTVLITGGTGSFGNAFTKYLLENDCPKKIIIYSRDEMKQYFMKEEYKGYKNGHVLQFLVGDIRDKNRLDLACNNVDYIIHAAAMKIVTSAEENPTEAIRTNVLGAMNLIDVAIKNKVKKVLAFSTDKACNPVNLYGATKLCSDKLFVAANAHSRFEGTMFSVVRYGNVIGSRGSIIPIFLEKKKEGIIPVTDERMTRFFITIEQGVGIAVKGLECMQGGEIFVPKIPSMKIVDLAKAIAPECEIKYIGIKPGEKLFEDMIVSDDVRNTLEFEEHYVIQPDFDWWNNENHLNGKQMPEGLSYSSHTNPDFLTIKQIKELIKGELPKMKVLVTGCNGFLGSNLIKFLSKENYEIIGTSLNKFNGDNKIEFSQGDLSDINFAKSLIKEFNPEIIINTVALANVDSCEENIEEARRINVLTAENLAKAIRNKQTKLIHISSDQLFNGSKQFYSEEDFPNPLNVYGKTKFEAEKVCLNNHQNTIVVRTNFFGWNSKGHQPTFAEWIFNSLIEKKEIKMFTDLFFTPIEVSILVKEIEKLFISEYQGILNIVGSEKISKYSFGRMLAEKLGLDKELIKEIKMDDFGFKAPRPKDMSLSIEKYEKIFKNKLPDLNTSLDKFVNNQQIWIQ